jgi:3-oxoacyl-[acyl-carrier-protein] synthase II
MNRVVVTGMGVVTPLGNEVDTFIDALLAGRSGITPINAFDASQLPTRIAGQAPLRAAPPLGDRKIAFALEAAASAMASAFGDLPLPSGGAISMGVGLELFSMRDLVEKRRPGFSLPSSEGGLEQRLRFMQTPSGLKIAYHGRVWMRAGNRADNIKGVVHVRDPITHRLI